ENVHVLVEAIAGQPVDVLPRIDLVESRQKARIAGERDVLVHEHGRGKRPGDRVPADHAPGVRGVRTADELDQPFQPRLGGTEQRDVRALLDTEVEVLIDRPHRTYADLLRHIAQFERHMYGTRLTNRSSENPSSNRPRIHSMTYAGLAMGDV